VITQYKLTSAKTILNKSGQDDDDIFAGTINPYTGCEHGCVYCYVQAERYQPYKNKADFFRTIAIKQNAVSLLNEILQKGLPYGMACIGSSSDPYQPAEEKHKITRSLLETINKYGYPVHIFTKSSLVLRDLDILKEISKKSGAAVSFSIITLDPRTHVIFEPGSISPQERLKAMKELSKNGITCGLSLMPVLPYITDDEKQLEALIKAAGEHGAQYVWSGCLTLRDKQHEKYRSVLLKDFPGLVSRYAALYKGRHSPAPAYAHRVHETIFKLANKYSINYGLEFVKKSGKWGKGLTPIQKEFEF